METLLVLVILFLAVLTVSVLILTRAVGRVADEIRRFHDNGNPGNPPSFRVSSLLTLLLSGIAAAGSPGEAVAAASADAARLPVEARKYVRYLSLYHVSDKKTLNEWQQTLSFWTNSLSRESEFGAVREVQPGLWRIDLRDFALSRTTWEKLAEVEPYWHAKVTERVGPPEYVKEPWPGGVWPADGKYYAPGSFTVSKPKAKPKEQTALAPWLPTREAAALTLLTGSAVPIVRADWFLVQTAQQAGRGTAGYYDFLAVKDRREFQALVGLDQKLAEKLQKETRAQVITSGVALNNRAIIRFATITGAFWTTLDSNKSTNGNNAARQLDADYQHDAEEVYGTLPNGLFAFGLFDAKGNRQDSAPDTIASDSTSLSNDRRVHVGISCTRCHLEGIRPIDDYARRVYRQPLALGSPDYDRLKRLRRLYLSDLEEKIKRDQADYGAALFRVNGLKSVENAKLFARLHAQFEQAHLGLEEFARELGVSKTTLLVTLKIHATPAPAGIGALDPVLAGLLSEPPVKLRREHADELFALTQTLLRGVPR